VWGQGRAHFLGFTGKVIIRWGNKCFLHAQEQHLALAEQRALLDQSLCTQVLHMAVARGVTQISVRNLGTQNVFSMSLNLDFPGHSCAKGGYVTNLHQVLNY